MSEFRKLLEYAINCASKENGSDTPDFILAEYLDDCLTAYDRALVAREKWYGRSVHTLHDKLGIPSPNDPKGPAE